MDRLIKYKIEDVRDTMGKTEEIYHAPRVDKVIEQLKKEKEWLLKKCVRMLHSPNSLNMSNANEIRDEIIAQMNKTFEE